LQKQQVVLGDVFKRYLENYRRTHKLSPFQQKVVEAIQRCRTVEMGGYIERCDGCEYSREFYHSCRNRHCPTCQGSNRRKWVQQRMDELLPIPYYHVVFTMPHSLNLLALYNKETIYEIFFKAVAHTIETFAQDPKYLGAKPGYIGILHTWGQTLSHHIHLHFIITGGGLTENGRHWVDLPYQEEFIFPVLAMSRRMRKRFAELLEEAYEQKELSFPDKLSNLSKPFCFERFLNKVAWQNWVIYSKKPFAGPEEVVKYIGRYTHRVAISNGRLLDIDGGKVTFRYKQYKTGLTPTMSLKSDLFIQRFLWHIIPKGFKRIRHFGFFANGCRTAQIALAKQLLRVVVETLKQVTEAGLDLIESLDLTKCPVCKIGFLKLQKVFAPYAIAGG